MYNETYDEYIRSILGYSPMGWDHNNYQEYRNQAINYDFKINKEVEKYYPEIYKIVYPMIVKRCSNINNVVTKEDIENMTDEIYSALEERNDNKVISNNTEVQIKEVVQEKRNIKQIDKNLYELIKILMIRELSNRPNWKMRPQQRPFVNSLVYDIFEY